MKCRRCPWGPAEFNIINIRDYLRSSQQGSLCSCVLHLRAQQFEVAAVNLNRITTASSSTSRCKISSCMSSSSCKPIASVPRSRQRCTSRRARRRKLGRSAAAAAAAPSAAASLCSSSCLRLSCPCSSCRPCEGSASFPQPPPPPPQPAPRLRSTPRQRSSWGGLARRRPSCARLKHIRMNSRELLKGSTAEILLYSHRPG